MTEPIEGTDLRAVAPRVVREHGFEPVFPPAVDAEVQALAAHPPEVRAAGGVRDLRDLLWSSIDNDTSRDLDQIEVAGREADGAVRIRIGIADVDAFAPKGSAIDQHAAREATTVYAGVAIFPMLPTALSTGATSLLEGQDRLAVVIDVVVARDGTRQSTDVYRAIVRNRAQLTYDGVGAWLDRQGPPPPSIAASTDLAAQLELQAESARLLRTLRHRHGALDIETIEAEPVLRHDRVVDLARQRRNAATDLIEDFMIAANGAVVTLLDRRGVASIRRVVKTPERWNRIVELAQAHGGALPAAPDSKALSDFLSARKAADPDRFADLSLAVIKLLGPGEYTVERPGGPTTGHFGLAVQNYTHATAPNRRYADLVTQRILKAAVAGSGEPYTASELETIARDCTVREDAARKVEREMAKRIAAVAMTRRIGEVFEAIVTGVTPKGTFVRVAAPPVEGLLAHGQAGVDVGDRLRVKLIRTDVSRGYIDFARA